MSRSKLLGALVLVALCASSAQAQVAFTQAKASGTGQLFATDGIDALAFDASVGSGSFVVVGIALEVTSRTISSVVDDGSNTYTLLSQGGTDAHAEETTFNGAEVWIYGAPITTTMQTVTITISSALPAEARIWLWEVDGQHATTPIEDVAIASQSTGTSHATGPVTTAAAGSGLIGALFGSSGSYTDDSGWTSLGLTTLGLASYRTIGAASTSWTVTTGGNEATARVLVAIAPAGGAAAAPCTMMLLGVGRCDH